MWDVRKLVRLREVVWADTAQRRNSLDGNCDGEELVNNNESRSTARLTASGDNDKEVRTGYIDHCRPCMCSTSAGPTLWTWVSQSAGMLTSAQVTDD